MGTFRCTLLHRFMGKWLAQQNCRSQVCRCSTCTVSLDMTGMAGVATGGNASCIHSFVYVSAAFAPNLFVLQVVHVQKLLAISNTPRSNPRAVPGVFESFAFWIRQAKSMCRGCLERRVFAGITRRKFCSKVAIQNPEGKSKDP